MYGKVFFPFRLYFAGLCVVFKCNRIYGQIFPSSILSISFIWVALGFYLFFFLYVLASCCLSLPSSHTRPKSKWPAIETRTTCILVFVRFASHKCVCSRNLYVYNGAIFLVNFTYMFFRSFGFFVTETWAE